MKLHFLVASPALFVLLSAAPAAAQSSQPQVAPASKGKAGKLDRFRIADADQDGFLTLGEARAVMPVLAESFDQADADGNGKLSRDEVDTWNAKRRSAEYAENRAAREREFKLADTNGDGFVSREEAGVAKLATGSRFDAYDADADGRLSVGEYLSPPKMVVKKSGQRPTQTPRAAAGEGSSPASGGGNVTGTPPATKP